MRLVMPTALLAASLFCHPAYAQDGEIVVTATRTPTPADRLPARIDVISRAEIEARSFSTLAEALGAEAVQSGGAGQQTSLFLRGANSKHVLALFDGIRLNDASTPNGQYDFGQDTLGALARVEVLRGPASAVFGSDAVGGAVNLIPRRGGESAFDAYGEAAIGSFATTRVLLGAEGDVNGLAYGVSAESLESAGHDLIPDRMITNTGDSDGARVSTFTATARHDGGGYGLDGLVRVRRSEAAFDTFSGGPFFDLRADDPDLETEATQIVWRMGGDLDVTETLTLRAAGGEVVSERSEFDNGAETSRAESTRSFADASAHHAGDGVTLTAGLALERNAIQTRPQFSDPLRVVEEQSAVYFIGQIELGAGAVITGALRADDYESFGTHTTYALGAVTSLDELRLFVSFATAFKAPSLTERFETSAFNLGNPALAPERSTSWEIGADWSPSQAFNAHASLYQTRIAHLIDYDFPQSKNINVGEAAIDGAEISLEALPMAWASFGAAYSWTDARNGITGAQLARRPRRAWRVALELEPGEGWIVGASWGAIGARTDVTYSDAGTFQSGAGRAPDFGVGALWLRHQLNTNVGFYARIDNLTDADYEQPAAFAGSPRSAQVGLRAKF